MKILTIESLAGLAEVGEGPVVTLIGPVRTPVVRARAALEWRQLLHAARNGLSRAGVRTDAIERMLAPVEDMLVRATRQGRGARLR